VTAYSTTSRTRASNNIWFGSGGPVPGATASEIFAGAITGDPKFVNRAIGDVRLLAGSAAIDRGSAAPPVPSVDFDNVPRPQGASVDIGAFEWR
jgi:hypothetical protein